MFGKHFGSVLICIGTLLSCSRDSELNVVYCVFLKGLHPKHVMETAVLNLQSLYDEMRSQIDLLNDNIEPRE